MQEISIAKEEGPFSQVKKPKGSYFMFAHENAEMMRKQNPEMSTV